MISKRILFIILVVLVSGGCRGQEPVVSRARKTEKQKLAPESVITSIEERRREIISQRDLPSNMYGRDNPFAAITAIPSSSRGRKKGELKLEGLITDPKQPFALINDMILKEGDSIDGKRVIKIDTESVILEDEEGRKYILKLF